MEANHLVHFIVYFALLSIAIFLLIVFAAPKASDITASAPSTTAATSSSVPSGAKQEIQEAKTSGVATGAAAATAGVAAAAAGTAAAVGLGKSETDGVTGVEKVGPGVTQAVPNGSAVSEKGMSLRSITDNALEAT